MKHAVIQVRGLKTQFETQFGPHIIHEGLDLDLLQGEILGVVGGSGSGKSVLMQVLLGLHRPTAGTIHYEGASLESAQRITGVLFQHGALYSSLTVLENVTFPLIEITKLKADQAIPLALHKLSLVGLSPDVADKKPFELSGGMVKRVSLARALAIDPKILFLDEPTAGLDPVSAAAFDALIKKLHQQLALTIFMVTHDLDSLFTVCHRVALLLNKKAHVGTLKTIVELQDPWVQAYFNGPRGRAVHKSSVFSEV